MANSGETYRVKSATVTEGLVVMAIAVVVVADLVRRAYITGEQPLLYAGLAVLVYCAVLTLVALIRVVRKPHELVITRTAISSRGRTLEALQVEEIMINGLSRKLIGIKPKGSRIVPAVWAFRFVEDAGEAFRDLEHWAKVNKVTMTEKKFFKWI
ncbi:hypothetical protein [Paenibacillus pinistramenti]|uniref:hypothetical protein n=1 Tax=Paenibacillus pinistramenti TaxID=1768003 RepID=UPI00110951BD|nr:hypothetical protein [Paenibacillus pinistramenti]